MTRSLPFHKAARREGAALIITLFFIVIITTLSVAYMTSSRMERTASSSHFERAQATVMARSAVDRVIATLQRETSDPNRNWVSQPGVLTVPRTTSSNRLEKTVILSSGAPSTEFLDGIGVDPVLLPANVNVQTLQDQGPRTYLILDPAKDTATDPNGPTVEESVAMKLRWLYVRKDGSLDLENLNPDLPVEDNLATEKPDLTNKSNPIIGRYAYWTDDESAKVNYNLAWTRDPILNKNSQGHQTKIDLRALPDFELKLSNNKTLGDVLHTSITKDNYATIQRFFNSPLDARRIALPSQLGELGLSPADGAIAREALDRNKFNVTHYSHDPDTTYYGKSRMMLTTQLSNAMIRDANGNPVMVNGKPLTRPYLDILARSPENNTAYIDPGTTGAIDGSKLNKIVRELVDNYLKKSDWPMVDGTGNSLQKKYYANYTGLARDQRLAQIALNIIDYVRSAESRRTVVEPIRAKFDGSGSFVSDFVDTSLRGKEDTFKGLVRAPYITEMGIWMSNRPETTGPNAGRLRTFGFVEVFLPRDYGIDSLNLLNTDGKTWQLYFKEFGSGNYYLRNGSKAGVEYPVTFRVTRDLPANSSLSPVFVWEAVGNPARATMQPGEYRTLAFEVWRAGGRPSGPILLRSAITVTGGARIDVAPLGDPNSTSPTAVPKPLTYILDVPNDEPMSIKSYETVDPRVNGVANDWKLNNPNLSGQPNTFGQQNYAWSASVGKAPLNILPEQDLDKDGKVSAASFRMPYPFGHAQNLTGRVRSSGELGLIHTGIEGSSTASQGGIPWRSLHLQPSRQGTTVVPDWAFMDLFTVPADVPQKASVLFTPHSSSTGGRVNMNAKPEPFPNLERLRPLAAVLYNARRSTVSNQGLTLNEAIQVAANIYNRVPAKANGGLPAGKHYPASSALQIYDSPGEVVEMLGVADGGEESEELVREIANLITARGNVFSVYTIGQALKQTPDGRLIVTAEQRQQAFIERYLIDKNTPDPSDDEVGFRSVYFRNLTP